MGLFDLFKKKETKRPTISPDDSIGDIAVKLAQAGAISVPKDDNHNTFGEPLDHLVDGELPWGWVAAKKAFIEPRDKKLFDLHIRACKATSVLEEKALNEEFLEAFYSYKHECEQLGECYIKYFADMFERCQNSSNPCFSMAEPREERLAYINANINTLVAAEQLKTKLLSTLESDVANLIRSNPGILQSELIKKFDPIVKGELSTLLYQWSNEGKITKEKQGRSFALTML